MFAGPYVEDLAGNPMDQDRDGEQGEPDDGEPDDDDDVYDASFNLVDVDLTLSNVVVDATELWAGESVDVSWDGSNASGMPLFGDWTDAVYFSADDRWDIDDKLLATVPHTGGLAQDETYRESLTFLVPGALPGDYYVVVRADLYNQEKEGGDEGNNVVAVGPIPLEVRPLAAGGGSAGGTLTASDRSDFYAIDTQTGDNLAILLDGLAAEAHAELFVSYEQIPMRLTYDHRSTTSVQGGRQLVIAGALEGTYYALIYADELSESSPYDLAADAPEIIVSDITPERNGVGSPCTMTITGGGFDKTTTVQFVGSDEAVWTPAETQFISPTTTLVTLNVPTWPQDVYDIVVTKAGVDPYELEDSFEVTGGVPNLDTRVVVPDTLGYHWFATIWIEYANTGEASMPAPLFKLHGTDDAILTLDQSLAGRGLWTSTPPAGTSDTVQVMATGSGATPGILQPGDSGRIPVYCLGQKQPWDFSDRTIEFDLGVLAAEETEPIDWAGMKDDMRPESMPTDAWDAIWANLTDQVGSTWGDYVAMLDDNMNYLHVVGQDVTGVSSLLAFEVEQASASNPYGYLAADTDAWSPAPGLALVFSRVYGQSIGSRYQLGPLGRGWDHNWGIWVEELSEGDVVLHGPGGVDRYFTNDGGTYIASPGDYGTLTESGGNYRLTEKHGTVWQFRSDDLLDYVEDTNANRITTGYTSGRLTSLTHSNGDQLLLDYHANGRIWHLTDPLGPDPADDRVTTFEYDPSGEHLLTVTAPGNRVTRYTYDTGNGLQREHALVSVEYPDGTHDYFSYDDHGRLEQTYGDGGVEAVSYGYDSAGTVTVEDATARQAVLSFGLGGQLVQVRDGEGNVIGLGYDDDYQLTQFTGGSGQQYRYSYDPRGNLVDIEDPVRKHTDFAHTSTFNDLQSVTDARGNGMEYDYLCPCQLAGGDFFGRLRRALSRGTGRCSFSHSWLAA